MKTLDPYAGMERFKARKAIWADMQADGLVIKEEDYQMNVPRSQRGGEIIEPLHFYATGSWKWMV